MRALGVPVTTRLVIETTATGKGRSFSALVLARVYASAAWSSGCRERGQHRPALLLLGCADNEVGAIRANIQEGRKMRLHGPSLNRDKGEACEILKSEHFAISSQRTDAGTLLLVRHPELFLWQPGLVSDEVRFVCLPSRAALAAESARFDGAATLRHLARCGYEPWTQDREDRENSCRRTGARLVDGLDDPLFPTFSALLVAGIAQRMSFPILGEPLFWAQLTAALLHHGLVRRHDGSRYAHEIAPYAEVGTTDCGYYPGACVSASQAQIGEVLAAETASFIRR